MNTAHTLAAVHERYAEAGLALDTDQSPDHVVWSLLIQSWSDIPYLLDLIARLQARALPALAEVRDGS